MTDSLGKSAETLGQGFRDIPHIRIGASDQQPPQVRPVQTPTNQQMQNPQVNIPINQYDPMTEKFRKWMFWILTMLIGGLAVVLVVWRIALRFIG